MELRLYQSRPHSQWIWAYSSLHVYYSHETLALHSGRILPGSDSGHNSTRRETLLECSMLATFTRAVYACGRVFQAYITRPSLRAPNCQARQSTRGSKLDRVLQNRATRTKLFHNNKSLCANPVAPKQLSRYNYPWRRPWIFIDKSRRHFVLVLSLYSLRPI